MAIQKKVISILLDNHPGVLTRVTSLFGRRGFNIDSLTVSLTNKADISRITLTTTGDDSAVQQIIAQSLKLEEVRDVSVLDTDTSVIRELLLVKLQADESNRGAITDITNVYKAKVVDMSVDSMILELTGEQNKLDGFIAILEDFNILEISRTGITALSRGDI